MSKAPQIFRHPLRLSTTIFVLAGVVTAIGACSSGEIASGLGGPAVASDDGDAPVVLAQQGLGWTTGACVCVPYKACSLTTATNGCVKSSEQCTTTLTKCPLNNSYCWVEADGTTCPNSQGTKTYCDGGYCGKCPGCYQKNGLCNATGGTTLESCASPEGYCENCDDRNECTKDECTTRGCTHTNLADTTSCTGGKCWGGVCCTTGCGQSGACRPGTDIAACGTGGDACKTCEKPSNPCIQAVCSEGGCSTTPVPADQSCSDGNACNGDEICDGSGNCKAGKPLDCTSSDPCVTKTCDSKNGCVAQPNSGSKCSDGDACTVGDVCDAAGKCVGGARRACNDGKTCTDDSCDPATGNCKNVAVANNTTCDDGAACTSGETCQNGLCTAGTVACDDSNPCTKDTVVCPSGTCSPDPVPMNGQACIPSDKCFYSGTCNAGACVGNTSVNCDDGNPCTKDSCDPTTGCQHDNEPATTSCVDGNPCTTDDHCRPLTGKCVGTDIVCAPLDDCHSAGKCDAATGRCDDPRRIDGFPCAKGTGNCAGGICKVNASGGAAGASGSAGDAGWAGEPIANAGSAGMDTAQGGAAGAPGELGGTNATGGRTGDSSAAEELYKRNPGGCNCNISGAATPRGLAWFGCLALALGLRRRQRRSL